MERTYECSIEQLDPQFKQLLNTRLQQGEKVITCYITEWHMMWVQLITERQVILMRAKLLQSSIPFRKKIVDSPDLIAISLHEIQSTECYKNPDYDLYTVHVVSMHGDELEANFISQQKAGLFLNALQNIHAMRPAVSKAGDTGMAARLKELQEIHQAGLITDEEFAEKRRDILSSL